VSPEDGAIVVDLAILASSLWDTVAPWLGIALCALLALAGLVAGLSASHDNGPSGWEHAGDQEQERRVNDG